MGDTIVPSEELLARPLKINMDEDSLVIDRRALSRGESETSSSFATRG